MAKKKAGGKRKGKKSARPKWMSEEVFALSQDLPRLIDHFAGTASPLVVDPDHAGILLWRTLSPSDKKTLLKREDALKMGLVEFAVKRLVAESLCRTSAIGILTTLVQTSLGRDAFFGCKGLSSMALLLRCLYDGSVCLAVYACQLLALLAEAMDAKLRVMKGMQDWDWTPLAEILRSRRITSHLGGIDALVAVSKTIAALCCLKSIPESAAPNPYRQVCESMNEAVINAEIVESLAEILRDRVPGRCKVHAMEAFRTLLLGTQADLVRDIFIRRGGRESVVSLLKNAFFTLPIRAMIVECLFLSLLPIHERPSSEPPEPSTIEAGDVPWSQDLERLKTCGVVPMLLALCVGPEGPLPEITTSNKEALERTMSSKKRKGKKKKKAQKLLPGMANAQTYATGCLRILITVVDDFQNEIVSNGGIRYLTPLLASKVQQARWNARQILLTLAGQEETAKIMERYNVPKYITQCNIPRLPLP